MTVLCESDLLPSPAWFPVGQARSAGDLAFVNLDQTAYAAASFLDERILALNPPRATASLATIRSAAASLPPRAHYIFHTGHVGSTLVSRLIGAHASFFSLREPGLLRALALGSSPQHAESDVSTLVALLSRTWWPGQRAVIKATSFVNELAADLLGLSVESVAILMYASPANYLRGILGGPNSRVESRSLAPLRLKRLDRRLGLDRPPAGTSQSQPRAEGEQIAMSWLSEMAALYQAAQRYPSRVLWVDFDAFLREPVAGLQNILRALGVECPVADVQALVANPIMRQYSKGPEHSYDAALRREVLALAEWEHPVELRQGMEWLRQVCASHPSAAEIVRASSTGSPTAPP
jgi:hypothetical protein